MNKIIYIYLESFKEPTGELPMDIDKSPSGKEFRELTAQQLMRSLKQGQSCLVLAHKEDPLRNKFVEYLKRLEPSFKRFKKTKACRVLRDKIYNAEMVSERIYN